jgi:hypothetical protein
MTKTDKLYIDNTEEKASAAIDMVDEFLADKDLDRKKKIHLRLLAEETVGMVKAMTEDFEAFIWMEEDNGEYRVKLNLKTEMDREKKEELLSLSTTGENTAAKGFMGRLREVIENSLLDFDSTLKLQQQNEANVGYNYMGMGVVGDASMAGTPIVWSLAGYKQTLEDGEEAWDELERSIVASLAKDVTIGIRSNVVDMTILAR